MVLYSKGGEHTSPYINSNTHNFNAYDLHIMPSCKTLTGLFTDLECCHSVLMDIGAHIEPSGHKVQVESGDMAEALPVILEGEIYV